MVFNELEVSIWLLGLGGQRGNERKFVPFYSLDNIFQIVEMLSPLLSILLFTSLCMGQRTQVSYPWDCFL